MKPVVILPESITPEEVASHLPVGTYAFVWSRDHRNRLGIRLVEHRATGPRFSGIYETGSEFRLRIFANDMVARHPNERWVFDA